MINDQYDTGDQCQWVYQHVLSAHVFNLGDWGGVEEGRWRGVGEGVGLPGWVLGGVSVRVLGSVWCVVVGRECGCRVLLPGRCCEHVLVNGGYL